MILPTVSGESSDFNGIAKTFTLPYVADSLYALSFGLSDDSEFPAVVIHEVRKDVIDGG